MINEEKVASIDVSVGYQDHGGDSSPVNLQYHFHGSYDRPPEFVHSGTLAWLSLHSYEGCDEAWLLEWEKTIPSAGCGCHSGYLLLKEEFPPDFSSSDAFFAWGVALHNGVNRKLGKQELSLEEARLLWRSKDVMEDQEARH
jgi:hypothetical protein